MPIPVNRFSIKDEEFDVPSGTFMSPANTSTSSNPTSGKGLSIPNPKELSVSSPDISDPFTKGKEIDIEVNTSKSDLLGDIPGEFGGTDKTKVSSILKDIADASIRGKDLAGAITGAMAKHLGPEINKAYKDLLGIKPPTIAGNIIRVKPKNKQLGCDIELNALKRALGLGGDGTGIGLLALLNKLLCAGISNGLSLLIDQMDIEDTIKKRMGESALLKGAKLGDLDTIADVASLGLGPLLKSEGRNVIKEAMSTLRKASENNASISFESVDGVLSALDPAWGKGDYSSVSTVDLRSRQIYHDTAILHLKATKTSTPGTTSSTSSVVSKAIGVKYSKDTNKNPLSQLLSTL